jgi:hypothetical protein
VDVIVTADKKLVSGELIFGKDTRKALTPGEEKLVLDPTGTPLEKVAEPLRFKVQVVDEHGMGLERPISCAVQVTPDRPPRIAAAAISRYVLPTASPQIRFQALDDYGVSEIVLHQTISRADANQVHTSATIARLQKHPNAHADTYTLALEPLKLNKGDRVSVTLEAVDYRGESSGRPGRSDPVSFLVTDIEGLLQAMSKFDERTVEKLDEIIQAQLGIGE